MRYHATGIALGLIATLPIGILLGTLNAFSIQSLLSQNPSRSPAVPKWEVVVIRPCSGRLGAPLASPGRISECNTVFGFINFAYILFPDGRANSLPVPGASVEGGPAWIRSDQFSITAKAEGTPTIAMMRGPMLQAILEDRFNLKIHRETKEVPVFTLVVGRGGPKLQAFKQGSCSSPRHDIPPESVTPSERQCQRFGFGRGGRYKIDAEGLSIEEFCTIYLGSSLGRPVIDKTGITGLYDFHLEWSAPPLSSDPTAPLDTARPSIFTVLEQLGLKLESSKGPVPVFKIDSVERPSEN